MKKVSEFHVIEENNMYSRFGLVECLTEDELVDIEGGCSTINYEFCWCKCLLNFSCGS